MYNYVVTAHKPSNVHLSVTGNFTSADETNLIVAKCNRLVIYDLTPEGLQPERQKVSVVEYAAATGQIVTKFMEDVQARIGTPVDSGQTQHANLRIIGQPE
ncbi:hypothetical protein T484DRAFT_1796275 [Baffinella frigidus]|nr:hypothetical protein T484DRAFT_1796275 [Cryptophyta sp. CCMP2293]